MAFSRAPTAGGAVGRQTRPLGAPGSCWCGTLEAWNNAVMNRVDLLALLAGPWGAGTRPKALFALHVSKRPDVFLPDILAGLGSKERRVQGGAAELASLLSEARPDLLYPHVDLFLRNLTANAPILRWEAVCTLGNLASIDVKERIPPRIDSILACLSHESIVLQGHAVRTLGKLTRANPKLGPKVLGALLGAQEYFPGNRIGFVVETMPVFASDPVLREKARKFVEKWTTSEVSVVASKARKAMKALAKEGA